MTEKQVKILLIVMIIILSVTCFRLYNSLQILSQTTNINIAPFIKSNTVSNDVIIGTIFGKIDSNFNLIILTVTVLFTLFGVLNYIGVREAFSFQLSSIKDKLKHQETIWDEHSKELKSLKGDLSFEVADKMEKDLKEMFKKEDKKYDDFVSIVEHSLVACGYYSESLFLKSDVYPKFKNAVLNIIKKLLEETATLISTQDKFELNNLGYERFLRLQENIHKVSDIEDKQNLALIFSKLSFPTLD